MTPYVLSFDAGCGRSMSDRPSQLNCLDRVAAKPCLSRSIYDAARRRISRRGGTGRVCSRL
jgi:hypothetical protein